MFFVLLYYRYTYKLHNVFNYSIEFLLKSDQIILTQSVDLVDVGYLDVIRVTEGSRWTHRDASDYHHMAESLNIIILQYALFMFVFKYNFLLIVEICTIFGRKNNI